MKGTLTAAKIRRAVKVLKSKSIVPVDGLYVYPLFIPNLLDMFVSDMMIHKYKRPRATKLYKILYKALRPAENR